MKVGEEEVLGVRAPGAKPGNNTQYEVRTVTDTARDREIGPISSSICSSI